MLDVMLPGIDGVETARRIRARSSIPILMLTARDSDLDIVVGLEAGADDYVVKPVEPRVLDARIRALLRRTERPAGDAEQWGDLRVSRDTLIVTRGGLPLELSPTELRLLLVLTSSPGRVFSRLQLLEQVWEQDYLGDSRLVDATVQRLRAKVEQDPSAPRYIQTVRGFGYRFGSAVSRSFRRTVTLSLITVAAVSVIGGALLMVGLIGLGWLGGVDGIGVVIQVQREWFGGLVRGLGGTRGVHAGRLGIAVLLAVPIAFAIRLTSGRVIGPVGEVSDAAARVAAGELGTRVEVHGDDEMAARCSAASTRWPPPCRPRSSSWPGSRPDRAGSPATSPMSCARPWPR